MSQILNPGVTPVTPEDRARTEEWVLGAKIRVRQAMPYLSDLVSALRLVVTRAIETAAVDKRLRLYVNPDFFERKSREERAFIIAHEAFHVIFEHHKRLQGAHPRASNIACDLAINCILADGVRRNQKWELSVPDDAQLPEKYEFPDFLTAEEYYELLMQEVQQMMQESASSGEHGERDQNESSCGGGGSQSQSDPSNANTSGAGGGSQNQNQEGSGERNGAGGSSGALSEDEILERLAQGVAAGRCGSCAHGHSEAHELDPHDADNPGASEIEVQDIIRRTAERIASEEVTVAQIGKGAGFLKQIAQEILNPKIDWRERLRECVRTGIMRQKGWQNQDFSRPNRRADAYRRISPDVIYPSYSEPTLSAGVILDTSGSVWSIVNIFLNELKGIFDAVGYKGDVFVAIVDDYVYSVGRLRDIHEITEQIEGGGGTDLTKGFDALAEMQPNPSVVIVLTDAYTPWHDEKPKWCQEVIITRYGNGQTPDWADVVIDIDIEK